MQPSTSPKKPSPLSFGSPRTSPFKRPESPLARSPSTARPIASAVKSPVKPPTFALSPPSAGSSTGSVATAIFSPEHPAPLSSNLGGSNPAIGPAASRMSLATASSNCSDPLSRLHPAQVRELRESFQVLDRDNDGQVTREDIVEVLTQLGLDTSSAALSSYFPPSSPATLALPAYLSTLSTPLASLSNPSELSAAFAAFDVDDSGQIDVEELRDALMHTIPEAGGRALNVREIHTVMEGFSGRRALSKGMVGKDAGRRGDVFRYGEFMSTIQGAEKEDVGKGPAAQRVRGAEVGKG